MSPHPRSVCLIGFLCLLPMLALAEKPTDSHALAGVETGKVAWDINMGDAKKLRLYLQVMAETYDDLKRQGVEPEMIFTFRGPSLPLISTEHGDVPLEDIEHHEAVAEQISALQQRPGVRMEACSIAARLFGVEAKQLLPGINFVGNTFVSQIGYQSKGYASIPIF
ncbi:MAG: hypothetical protein EOM91_08780 [Sphingobacteriia bacterium]|nr:hypothetical protein [Sphingobacteriia bacterium]NCC40167.1 hypothetical protein [Gammaproteobacteria bacterium]